MRVHIGWLFIAALAAMATGYAAAEPVKTPKGYLLAEIEVTDPGAYKRYVPGATAAVAKYGGRYLARGGRIERLEGAAPAGRFVIVAFPSFAAARDFYHSPDYQAIAPIRRNASVSRFWLAEGLPE